MSSTLEESLMFILGIQPIGDQHCRTIVTCYGVSDYSSWWPKISGLDLGNTDYR